METQIKTHWKKLQHPDYIGAYELMDGANNREIAVKIESVKREMITGPDGKKEECTIMLIPPHKPMILNATNQKTLTKVIGSPFIEDWAGKSITLYVAKVKAFGEIVDALRIRDELPKPPAKPEFKPDNPQWAQTVTAIKDKVQTAENVIKAILKSYSISPATEKLLKDAAI